VHPTWPFCAASISGETPSPRAVLAERPWASSISVQATAPCLQATCSAVLPDSVADAASIVPASSSACSAAPLSAMIFFSIGLGRKLGWGGAAAEAEARLVGSVRRRLKRTWGAKRWARRLGGGAGRGAGGSTRWPRRSARQASGASSACRWGGAPSAGGLRARLGGVSALLLRSRRLGGVSALLFVS
jgi:hypothetical protein